MTFSPAQFGAKGDGVADDTAALNAMYLAAAQVTRQTPDGVYLGGGLCDLGSGTYRCTADVLCTPIPSQQTNIGSHITTRGDNQTACLLIFEDGGLVGTGYPGGNWSSEMHFEGFSIYNVNARNKRPSGLYMLGAADCSIDRVTVSGFAEGIALNDCDDIDVSRMKFCANTKGVPAAAGSIGVALRGATNRATIERCQFNGPAVNVLHAGGVGHAVRDCNSEGGILARFQDVNGCTHEGWTQEGQDATDTPALFHFDAMGSAANALVALGVSLGAAFLGGSTKRDVVLFDETAIVYDLSIERFRVAAAKASGVVTLPYASHVGGYCYSLGTRLPAGAPLFSHAPPQWKDLA